MIRLKSNSVAVDEIKDVKKAEQFGISKTKNVKIVKFAIYEHEKKKFAEQISKHFHEKNKTANKNEK